MAGPSGSSTKRNAAFHFVNVAPTPDMLPQPHQQREIRSHVMKQYKSKISRSQSKKPLPTEGNERVTRSSRRRGSEKSVESETARSRAREGENDKEPRNEHGDDVEEAMARTEHDFSGMQLIMHRNELCYNPVGLLGQGRVDPFQVYPTDPSETVNELMDHSVVHLWPGLFPSQDLKFNPISPAWLSAALAHPFLFRALVFAGSIHLTYLRSSKIDTSTPPLLASKIAVIRDLNEKLGSLDPHEAYSDEVILAVLVLASHETYEVLNVRKAKNPFNSPLKSVQWLDVYGSITYVSAHMKAIFDIVSLRGGLDKIELYGLGEVISYADIIEATKMLRKPHFPLLPKRQQEDDEIEEPEVLIGRPLMGYPEHQLGMGFLELYNHNIPSEAITLLCDMADLTLTIDAYLQGRFPSLTLSTLTIQRNALQHRLLSLPTAAEAFAVSPEAPGVYESLRLAALIFALAVTFPVTSPMHILETLVGNLQAELDHTMILGFWLDIPDILLWVIMLGGIASWQMDERSWFVSQFARVLDEKGITSWEDVEDILNRYLWLPISLGPGGKLLWSDALAFQADRDILSMQMLTLTSNNDV